MRDDDGSVAALVATWTVTKAEQQALVRAGLLLMWRFLLIGVVFGLVVVVILLRMIPDPVAVYFIVPVYLGFLAYAVAMGVRRNRRAYPVGVEASARVTDDVVVIKANTGSVEIPRRRIASIDDGPVLARMRVTDPKGSLYLPAQLIGPEVVHRIRSEKASEAMSAPTDAATASIVVTRRIQWRLTTAAQRVNSRPGPWVYYVGIVIGAMLFLVRPDWTAALVVVALVLGSVMMKLMIFTTCVRPAYPLGATVSGSLGDDGLRLSGPSGAAMIGKERFGRTVTTKHAVAIKVDSGVAVVPNSFRR